MSKTPVSATASAKDGLFGIPTSLETAKVVLIPVPWEVTTSYGAGTSKGPEAILEASVQVDLFDLELGNAYEKGYHLLPSPQNLQALNDKLKPKALQIRKQLEENGELDGSGQKLLSEINQGCEEMADWVFKEAAAILSRGQVPAVLGGDHSSPEGNIRAVCEAFPGEVGVLHIDAHADLRDQYQGFERSHASIMNNVMRAKWKPKKLVQVGIRDFSEEEFQLIQDRTDISTFFDLNLKRSIYQGESWHSICERIAKELPEKIYISFDIDGLSPEYCPSTGTPVPGGLSFDQATYMFRALSEAGKKIVGFDLNEVAPNGEDEWDGNVGARLLYKLCGWAVQGK